MTVHRKNYSSSKQKKTYRRILLPRDEEARKERDNEQEKERTDADKESEEAARHERRSGGLRILPCVGNGRNKPTEHQPHTTQRTKKYGLDIWRTIREVPSDDR